MPDKDNSFENFFDSVQSDTKDMSVKEKDVSELALVSEPESQVQTPKEMLSNPEVPPPSPHDIKEYEVNLTSFDSIVKTCREGLQSLPLGEKDYRQMEADLSVKRVTFSEDASPSELSRQLCLIQVMKDDLVGVMAEAHSNYLTRKRYVDILLNAFNSISQQKTADKRKGDAHLRLFEFIKGCSDAESFYTKCRYYFDNLESQHKTISRRITCMQAQLNLGEIHTAGSESPVEIEDDTAPGEPSWVSK